MPAEFGFGGEAARALESIYLTADILAQRTAVLDILNVSAGQCILDAGSGPGLLAASIAESTGPSGSVWGADLSPGMVAIARTRCGGSANTHFVAASATALPYPDGMFDQVVCTQVLEFVPEPATALREFHRVLRPRGRVLLMDTDWESCVWASDDDARMRRMLDAWDTHCPHPRLPRVLGPMLQAAGFAGTAVTVVPIVTLAHKAGSYSEGMIATIGRYAGKTGAVAESEIGAWRDGLEALDREGRYFFSLNRHVFTATRA